MSAAVPMPPMSVSLATPTVENSRFKKPGVCGFCGRTTALTFHHLIPRKLHRRPYYRKHFNREHLNLGVFVCRLCHDGIHDLYDESTLAKRYASVQSLLCDDALRKHFLWVSKQRVR